MAIRTSTEKIAQKETNVNLLTRQMGEMSGAIIAIIKIKKDLCIFCKGKRKDTKNKATNTDGSLVPVTTNKVIPYQNLKEVRQSYGINDQDPYFFI
jgi:hypothetical protein